jgi:hypothetical protein
LADVSLMSENAFGILFWTDGCLFMLFLVNPKKIASPLITAVQQISLQEREEDCIYAPILTE